MSASGDGLSVIGWRDIRRVIGQPWTDPPTEAEQRPSLTTQDLMYAFGASRSTIQRWVKTEKVPSILIEGRRLFAPVVVTGAILGGSSPRRHGYGPSGPNRGGRHYSAEELELLLSSASTKSIAAQLGRSSKAVGIARSRLRRGMLTEKKRGAKGRWFITPHAIARYRARVERDASYEQALARLIEISAEARFVRSLRKGCSLYVGPRPKRIRLVVGPVEEGKELPPLITIRTR